MTKIETKPDGIIVTMPVAFFREYKVEQFDAEMERMNHNASVWYRVMKNLPTSQPQYCYLVYGGKVQWRTNILEYQRNTTKKFPRPEGGFRTFKNANMVVLCGPTIRAPREFKMQGFQGFRYTEQLF